MRLEKDSIFFSSTEITTYGLTVLTTVSIPYDALNKIEIDEKKHLTIFYSDDNGKPVKQAFKVANRSHKDESWKEVLNNYSDSILFKLMQYDGKVYNRVIANIEEDNESGFFGIDGFGGWVK